MSVIQNLPQSCNGWSGHGVLTLRTWTTPSITPILERLPLLSAFRTSTEWGHDTSWWVGGHSWDITKGSQLQDEAPGSGSMFHHPQSASSLPSPIPRESGGQRGTHLSWWWQPWVFSMTLSHRSPLGSSLKQHRPSSGALHNWLWSFSWVFPKIKGLFRWQERKFK